MNETISLQQHGELLVFGAYLCPIPGYNHWGDFVSTDGGLAHRRGGTGEAK